MAVHCFTKTSIHPASSIPRNVSYPLSDVPIEPNPGNRLTFVQESLLYIVYSTLISSPLQVVRTKALLQAEEISTKLYACVQQT